MMTGFLWKFFFCFQLIKFCEGACGSLRVPYFGTLGGKCRGNDGDVCSLRCVANFKVHGSSTKTCNSTAGKWEPDGPFSCQDRNFRCEGFRPPRNGNLRRPCSSFVGSSCYVGCDAGYFVLGSERLVCHPTSLRWEPSKPTCRPLLCPELSPPPNGSLPSTGCQRHIGSQCEFSCKDGYHLLGGKSRSCTAAGVWVGKPTRCSKTCLGLAPRPNAGLWNQCSPGVYGKSCHVICRDGFRLNGSRDHITCTDHGTWDALLPSCIRVECDALEPPVNGSHYGNCRPGIFGMPCIFTCNYGYRIVGNESSICISEGKWSTRPPTCEKITCEEVPSENVATLSGNCRPGLPDTWCNVDCVPGFKTSKVNNVTCLVTGNWSPDIPACQQRVKCPPLKPPENGILDDSCTFDLESTCQQICLPEFVPIGPAYLNCLPSGRWDGLPRKCIPKSQFTTNDIVKNVIF